MSVPISACLLYQAAAKTEGARERLEERVKYNRSFGGFSFFPCSHQPRCPVPSEEQLADLAASSTEVAALLVRLAGTEESEVLL